MHGFTFTSILLSKEGDSYFLIGTSKAIVLPESYLKGMFSRGYNEPFEN